MTKTLEELRLALVNRPRNGHKGTFGTVLVIGGSYGMAGSVSLCGESALRAGAGLVRLAVPERILDTVAMQLREYTLIPLATSVEGRITLEARETILEATHGATAVVVGPGLGQSQELDVLVAELWETIPVPAVFDADALNALAHYMANCDGMLPAHKAERIITPHPGEFSRLVPSASATDVKTQRDCAVALAKENDIIVVLKGMGTQVTNGNEVYINSTGNPGMGTGGSGDVLAGIVASFYAQFIRRNLSLLDAVRLAVHLHGLAGDFAAQELGECSMIASDIIHFLSRSIHSKLRK